MTHAHLRKYMSRRTRSLRLTIITAVFVVGYIFSLATTSHYITSLPSVWSKDTADRGSGGGVGDGGGGRETLGKYQGENQGGNHVFHSANDVVEMFIENVDISKVKDGSNHPFDWSLSQTHTGRRLLANDSDDGTYPKDLISLEHRRKGAVALHIVGMIYMFIALAIVCDEFFVPALGVITEKLEISEDVSGATFMAAGGSAPELFTSLMGAFIAKTDVGIGTIVGSAVFNILFVIGMCAMFSKEVLSLTWWPLFRDVSFYSVSLLILIGFFSDDLIEWHEALVLFACYIAYVLFMKFNQTFERKFKSLLRKCRCSGNKVNSSDQLLNERGRTERSASLPFLHSASGHYRHGMVQLLIHTIDPLAEAKVHDKAMQLQATLQVIVNDDNERAANNNHTSQVDNDNNMQIKVISNGKISQNGVETNGSSNHSHNPDLYNRDSDTGSKVTSRDVDMSVGQSPEKTADSQSSDEVGYMPRYRLSVGLRNLRMRNCVNGSLKVRLEEEEEPLDMSWPDTTRKRITYIVVAPILVPLWLTLPDVRKPARRKYYPITFIGSILWIGGFSYLMVWWANQTGETIGIPDEVMGLTILAAGTSIPDLITSVIVAKKGFGDMAVSSSVGSNIFDITVGLPIPWLLYCAVNGGDGYQVSSKGLLCSIFLLFVMLLAVIICIAVSGWKMSKILGVAMMVLYLIFVTLSVLLEYEKIKCPVT